MLDLHRLAVWRAVVASGSVHSAAANLQYTPATVSQHIIKLQKAVGLPLYERRGRGIEPTPVGVRLAEESAEVFTSMRRLESVVADMRSGPSPRLDIRCFSSVAKEWMPGVVADVVAEFPEVQFEIGMIQPAEDVGTRESDLEIRHEVPSAEAAAVTGYVRNELLIEDYMLVLAADHPLAAEHEVTMAALQDEAWVDPDIYNTPAGRVVIHACQAAGYEPRFVAGSDDHYAALAMVAAGIGIAVLPELAARDLPERVHRVPLVDPTPSRRLVLQVREAIAHLDYVQAAIRLIEEQAARSSGR